MWISTVARWLATNTCTLLIKLWNRIRVINIFFINWNIKVVPSCIRIFVTVCSVKSIYILLRAVFLQKIYFHDSASWISMQCFILYHPSLSSLCHPLTQTCRFSLPSSFLSMTCECQILQAYFPHNMSDKYYLPLSVCKYISPSSSHFSIQYNQNRNICSNDCQSDLIWILTG